MLGHKFYKPRNYMYPNAVGYPTILLGSPTYPFRDSETLMIYHSHLDTSYH